MGVGASTKNWGAMQFSPQQWQSAFSLVMYTFANDTRMSQEAKMLVYYWSIDVSWLSWNCYKYHPGYLRSTWNAPLISFKVGSVSSYHVPALGRNQLSCNAVFSPTWLEPPDLLHPDPCSVLFSKGFLWFKKKKRKTFACYFQPQFHLLSFLRKHKIPRCLSVSLWWFPLSYEN